MDRKRFFDEVRRRPFGGSLTAEQVDGMTRILDEWDRRTGLTDIRWLAYALATTYHETARTMQPIKEYGGGDYFFRMYDPFGSRPGVAKELGNTKRGDGARYAGRGYVQLTGRTNYRKFGLEDTPEKALDAKVAARILFDGMITGAFTGKRLSNYFNDAKNDPTNARRIINGTDKAAQIAGYHKQFLAALGGKSLAPPAPGNKPDAAIAGTVAAGTVAAGTQASKDSVGTALMVYVPIGLVLGLGAYFLIRYLRKRKEGSK
jgi:putative chitinase